MSAGSYFLQTGRLGFRWWTPDDVDLARGLWGDPEVTRWIDARPHLDESAVRERLAREIALGERHGVQYWPIFDLETGEHVGCCGLRPHEPAVHELGFHVRSAQWGRGYAFEAARAVIEHAFARLGLEALFAGHHPKNVASARLLAKLGFHRAGTEIYPPTGLEHPAYRLGSHLAR